MPDPDLFLPNDLERLQEQLARALELEHLKSEFLRLAAHELRGPLAVVRGYLDMIKSGSLKADPVIPVLAGKVEEMNRLVEEMLETARLEENRISLVSQEFDLRSVARECANALAPLAAATHRFRFALSPGPVLVHGDRNRIAGVVTNVMDNAIKYSPAGGEIMVECSRDERQGTATIAVSDPGIGIAPTDLPRLFTRFGRIVTGENSHIGGTGLGLYISREVVRLHGGDITVRTRQGVGTKFSITLPAGSPGSRSGVRRRGSPRGSHLAMR